jgi:threonine/homoserine/homoserine lactone efflux protein
MALTLWLSLASICLLGAMAPGPSIAIIIQHTLTQGRFYGCVAALTHGVGIGCYAALATMGLAIVIAQSPILFVGLKIVGALFLAYLGCQALGITFSSKSKDPPEQQPQSQPFADKASPSLLLKSMSLGFFTALLNPKIALFFLALFSQFIDSHAALPEKVIMVATVAGVDMLWYYMVATIVSTQGFIDTFKGYGTILQKVYGVLLIAVAIKVVWG